MDAIYTVIFSLYEYVTSKHTVKSHTGCNEIIHSHYRFMCAKFTS